jgi:hypothetical protein
MHSLMIPEYFYNMRKSDHFMDIAPIAMMIGFLLVGALVLSYGLGLIITSPLAGLIALIIGGGLLLAGLVSMRSAFD